MVGNAKRLMAKTALLSVGVALLVSPLNASASHYDSNKSKENAAACTTTYVTKCESKCESKCETEKTKNWIIKEIQWKWVKVQALYSSELIAFWTNESIKLCDEMLLAGYTYSQILEVIEAMILEKVELRNDYASWCTEEYNYGFGLFGWHAGSTYKKIHTNHWYTKVELPIFKFKFGQFN